MTSRAELENWLGGTLARFDKDQLDRIYGEAENIFLRWPGPDGAPEREAAMTATVRWLLGETNVEMAGDALEEARKRLSLAMAAARQTARLSVISGMSEEVAAQKAGVDRGILEQDVGNG